MSRTLEYFLECGTFHPDAEKKQWTTLAEIIGGNVRRMRESHGVLQEQIARTARERFGLLEWVQGTVAAIESGKRYLSLEEFLLLPMILSFTWYDRERPEKFIELTDLLPESHDLVRLSKSAYVESWRLRQIVAGKAAEAWGVSPNNTGGGGGWVTPAKQDDLSKLPEDVKRAMMRFLAEQRDPSTPWKDRVIRVEIHSEAAGEAERKVARKFRVSPVDVATAAHKKWRRSLTHERDARLSKIDTANDPRRRQAVRGHITRQLIRELEDDLKSK